MRTESQDGDSRLALRGRGHVQHGGPSPVLDRVETAASELRRIAERQALATAVAVGKVLVRLVYDGDYDAHRCRAALGKKATLREIANHPDVPYSLSRLNVALRATQAVHRRGGLQACRGLTLTHFEVTSTLPPDDQDAQLDRAQREELSARQLKLQSANLARAPTRNRGGRRPAPLPLKFVRNMQRDMKEHPLDSRQLVQLSPKDADEVAEAVDVLRSRLDRAWRVLRRDP